MIEELQKLYNTMILIETKGESTKVMGECLKFIEHLIKLEREKEKELKKEE